MKIEITPLDSWVASRIADPGIYTPGVVNQQKSRPEIKKVTIADLEQYQLCMVKKTLETAMGNSPFYREHLSDVNLDHLRSIRDIQTLPFIFPKDLERNGLQMLCVSQGEISRVTTLQTSGTTSSPKRIFFTAKDLELTQNFFSHGMQTMVKPGEKVMVLMPGPNFGSVGERVKAGLDQTGCETLIHGFVDNPEKALEAMDHVGVDCIIGLPVQVLCLARTSRAKTRDRTTSPGRVKSVLLTGDHVPLSIIRAIKEIWGCSVFIHYGMTETGLGGGVECRASQGCHLREADLFFEIVDKTGKPLPPGKEGEITITTLTRTGMPLIRYRTGDRASFLQGPCPCGSNLRRLDRTRGRSVVTLNLQEIRLDNMDEALFSLDEILDFQVTLIRSGKPGNEQAEFQKIPGQKEPWLLNIEFWSSQDQTGLPADKICCKIHRAIYGIPAIRRLVDQGDLKIDRISPSSRKIFSQLQKRRIKTG
ncbi:MAG: AMP-binding protein [Desulfobacterium sp.]|nr:AMP-binding protein [Desulfobacterium sp.]